MQFSAEMIHDLDQNLDQILKIISDPKQVKNHWSIGTRVKKAEPYVGLKLTNRDIMIRAEVGRLTYWAHPKSKERF